MLKVLLIIVSVILIPVGTLVIIIVRDENFVVELASRFAEEGAVAVLDDEDNVASGQSLDELTEMVAMSVAEDEVSRVTFLGGLLVTVGLGLIVSVIVYL